MYLEAELQNLPPPVQRYFQAVLKDGQPMIAAVDIEHTGNFNLNQAGQSWMPFTSTQRVITQRTGFDWNGRIAMVPGVPVLVHDAYIGGRGILNVSLLGLFTLANIGDAPDAAQGELMRFAAVALWYPTRLLSSQGTAWEVIDDSHARMTITDGATRVALTFTFGTDGLITTVRADARARTVGRPL